MKNIFRFILLFLFATGLASAHDTSVILQAKEKLSDTIREIQLNNRVGTISVRGITGSAIHVRAFLKPGHGSSFSILGLFTWGGGGKNFSKRIIDGSIRFVPEGHDRLRIALNLPHDPHIKHLKVEWQLKIPQKKAVWIRNHVGTVSLSRMRAKIRVENHIGRISIQASTGPIFVHSNVGQIRISGLSRSLSVKNNVGSVNVQGAVTSIGTIDLKSNIGSVRVNGLPFSTHSGGLNGHFLYHGNGHHRIGITVNVGSIRVNLSPPPKPVLH